MIRDINEEKEFLNSYNPKEYESPSVTTDILVFSLANNLKENNRFSPRKVLKILLIKRKNHPYKGCWALPGGFVGINESIDDAAKRELKEEAGVENVYMEQLYTFGNVHRDPRMRVISTAYLALVPENSINPIAGDDATETQWFWVQGIANPGGYTLNLHGEDTGEVISYSINLDKRENYILSSEQELAFDHVEIINMALMRLKNKIEYTDIAFDLMPEKFTMSELKSVYEALLMQELDISNFKRDIKKKIIELDEISNVNKRMRLYKYNSNWSKKIGG